MASEAGAAPPADEPVEVIVQVREDVARALRDDGAPSPEAEALLAAAEAAGVLLAPVHVADSDDPSASYFRFEARDLDDARRVVEALGATEAVEAAYPKPRAYPPG